MLTGMGKEREESRQFMTFGGLEKVNESVEGDAASASGLAST